MGEKRVDHGVCRDPVGLPFERADHAMAECGFGDVGEVGEGHVGTSLAQRDGLGGEDHGLRSTDTGTKAKAFLGDLGSFLCRGVAGSHEAGGVAQERLGDSDIAAHGSKEQDALAAQDLRRRWRGLTGGAHEDLAELVFGGIGHHDLQEEPIELRLWERVSAFHFDRVFGGEDTEGLIEGIARTGDGDGVFGHGFEERGLGLGSGAVDLVGKDDLAEDGAFLDCEEASCGALARVHDEDIGTDDVARHQVGGELDTGEAQVEGLGEGANEEGLAEARGSFEEHVTAGDEGPEHLADHVGLADDDFADGVTKGGDGL